jgi:hypothetical protein
MPRVRTRTRASEIGALVAACCCALGALFPGVSAAAAGAPVLRSPASGTSVTAGKAIEFDWSGTLQGAASAQSQSMFRVELAAASDVPAGQDAPWPSLANFALTTPGSSETDATLGVPTPGSYRWRVCAWGVVNPAASNELESIACSPSQSLASVAAAGTDMGSVGEIAMTGAAKVVTDPDTVVTKTLPSTVSATSTNEVRTLPAKPLPKPTFDTTGLRRAAAKLRHAPPAIHAPDVEGLSVSNRNDSGWGSALGGLGNLGSGVVGALGWRLPGVPIPFWTLLLLMAPIPLAFWWKRSVVGMFDMPTVGDLPAEALELDRDGDLVSSTIKQPDADADGATAFPENDDHERLAA